MRDTRRRLKVRAAADGSPRFVSRQLGGEMLIVPVAGGVADLESIFTLNDVGARIWGLISERPRNVEEVAAVITREHDVAPERAAADVAEFIATLEREGLIGPEVEEQ